MKAETADRWADRLVSLSNVLSANVVEFWGEQWVLVDVEDHGVYWCNRVRHLRWLERSARQWNH